VAFLCVALAEILRARSAAVRADDAGRVASTGVSSFLFNPYTILTTLARSTATFDNALVLLSLSCSAQGRSALAISVLAIATRMALYPALLLPAILLYLPSPSPLATRAVRLAGLFAAFLAGLSMLERAVAGSWAAVFRNWSVILGIRDLTPNVGLSWCASALAPAGDLGCPS
jgi:phosphatidylinositol glycan class U